MNVSERGEEMTGGEAVVRTLVAHGVKTLFGLPGIQNDWLYNALYDARGAIRVIHTRHEQGAGYMALGQALATGDVAVCSVVPGPGVLNAGAALATAYAVNAPVVFLAGQIRSGAIGRGLGALHELPDQLGILRSLTKWADRATSPAEIPAKLGEALQLAGSGRPRPVALEIPEDVLAQRARVALEAPAPPPADPPLDEDLLAKAAGRLASARSPMIFAGGGALGACGQVRELAELLQAPVVAYRSGRGVLDSRHPLSLVQPAARRLWDAADVVLALGSNMRVPLQSWPAEPERTLIRVDIDPASHCLIRQPDIAITARVESAIPKLLERIAFQEPKRESRLEEVLAARSKWEAESAVLEPQLSYLKVIRECLGEDGIFVDELTQVGFASRIVMPVYHPRTFITPGYMGTLGYGFPTALGVKVARPGTPVVSVTGDGGFLFGLAELATAVRHRIGLVTLVFNNNQYGNVQQMQRELYGNRVIASDLVNPDFPRLAESFGAVGVRAGSPRALGEHLSRAFQEPGPTIIEVPVGDMPSVDRFR